MINVKKRRNTRILIILASIFGIALIGFLLSFFFTSNDDKKTQLTEKTENQLPSTKRNLQEESTILSKQYKDVVGWLRISGTSIDTAIFQSDNNDRYLRKDKDNKETKWGENFLDYRCDIKKMEQSMQHYIIYGHNTEVDTRFTPLFNYKKEEFFKTHQNIEFSTLYGNYKFQIFATYTTNTDFFYIDTKFKDADDYETFLKSLKAKSEYDTKVEVNKNDTILTLSTCDYGIENGRYVVQAKLVK
ncbi:MAG: class B sortase [Clostridia bacterium]|nr:class B sortase [Clostridia bacterium]